MNRMFVDTGAWFAYVNRSDPDHEPVVDLLDKFQGRLVTSNFILDETLTLCRSRLGHRLAVEVGRVLFDGRTVDVIRLVAADEQAAWRLFQNRADKAYSFTDCTSFVLLRRLGIQTAAALDADFEREGFTALPKTRA